MSWFERAPDRNNPANDFPSNGGSSDRAAGTTDPRRTLLVLFFVTVTSFGLGLWCLWPYLEAEHRRMDPELGLLAWVSDLVALAWFSGYFIKHYLFGKPLLPGPSQPARLTLAWWLAFVSLVAACGFDIWVAYRLGNEEQAGLARAVIVPGEIAAVEKKSSSAYHLYTIKCRFQDGQGAWQEGRVKLSEHISTQRFEKANLPAEVQQALRNGRVPCPVQIAYDPVSPGRNWIAGIDPGDGSRFYLFSLLIRLLQVVGIVMFLMFLRQEIRTSQSLPWWYDLHMVLPFMVEAAFLGLFGGLVGTGVASF